MSSLTKEEIQFSSEREETLILLLDTAAEAQAKRRIQRALVAAAGCSRQYVTCGCLQVNLLSQLEENLDLRTNSPPPLFPRRCPMPYTSINLNSVLAVSLQRAGRGKLKL